MSANYPSPTTLFMLVEGQRLSWHWVPLTPGGCVVVISPDPSSLFAARQGWGLISPLEPAGTTLKGQLENYLLLLDKG